MIVDEHRAQRVPGVGPLTVRVWQHATEIQVVALVERGAMVVPRSGIIGARPTARGAMRRTADSEHEGVER